MPTAMILSLILFIVTYALIVTEKINRTAIALFGAVLMVVFQTISQEEAFEHIDFNTIGLLIGMMIIINVLKNTGIFQYIAIRAAKFSKGDPWKILLLFSIITAISSALLDNVTTILLIVPVTFVITDTLKINPIPFLISEILASNIGGTATLIGDPPNLMIGGATDLGFLDFLLNLGPIVVVILIVTMFMLKRIYKSGMSVKSKDVTTLMQFNEAKSITNRPLLVKCLLVLGLTLIGFLSHQLIGLESATVALFGATLLLVISKVDPEEVLLEIEWSIIFFFAGLFVLVGALEVNGIIDRLAEGMLDLTKGDLTMTVLLVLWVSAVASSFLDNIPFVATMIPLIHSFSSLANLDANPLWWSLALGACLGGNGTLVGASSNVIVAGMLHKNGHKLSFMNYFKIGFPIMIISIIVATAYLLLFYV
jgi:Na+/H+ antiporter NhaD/arsenite permease-like protein